MLHSTKSYEAKPVYQISTQPPTDGTQIKAAQNAAKTTADKRLQFVKWIRIRISHNSFCLYICTEMLLFLLTTRCKLDIIHEDLCGEQRKSSIK